MPSTQPQSPSSSRPGTTAPNKRRVRTTLEQRRQVRYLTRHHPYLGTTHIIRTVGCAYSAIGSILANTYAGGDEDPDEPPKDEAFMKEYGVAEAAGLQKESDSDRPIGGDNVAAGVQDTVESREINSGYPREPLEIVEGPPTEIDQADLEWVSDFFNRSCPAKGLKVPESALTEMVAAGFKKWTVLNMMRTYPNRRDLAIYLATILRVTHAERDTIAALIMERKGWLHRGIKVED